MLIKFDDLSEYIPSGATITNATLSLYATGVYSSPGSSNGCKIGDSDRGVKRLYRVTKAWDEATVKWHSPWNSSGGEYSQTGYAECANGNASVWEDYEVTEMIKSFLDDPSTNHGFILLFRLDDYGCQYPSSESTTDESKRPKLKIEYIGTAINNSIQNINNNKTVLQKSNSHISFSVPYNNYSVRIYNANGKNIVSYNGKEHDNKLALCKLSTGIHLLNIEHNNCNETLKFIITK